MIIYKGGTVAGKGLYWNLLDGRRVVLEERGMLPGDESKRYLKVSPVGLVIIAPFLGLTYVLFLPLLGMGAFLVSCFVRMISTVAALANPSVRVCRRIAGRSVFFGWSPSRAYFTSSRKGKKQVSDSPGVNV